MYVYEKNRYRKKLPKKVLTIKLKQFLNYFNSHKLKPNTYNSKLKLKFSNYK